jgi:cobalt-zinc-cadmium efflux system protein
MAHDHSHAAEHLGDRRVVIAVALNLLLTIVEAVAAIFSGSLALAADALHNFSDCASLLVALIARRIARRPSDRLRTFGYRRAEIVGALVNLTTLVIIGLYLVYEALYRLFYPTQIEGWIVVLIATVALVIDVATAMLLWALSKGNLNMRAAFLHNMGDAFSSVGVIVAGAAILWFDAYWVDAVATLVIAGYVLSLSLPLMARSIHILMEGAPSDVDLDKLAADLQTIPGVREVHHVHAWELDEEHRAVEAHVVVEAGFLPRWVEIKQEAKTRLRTNFRIHHSTLEFETPDEPQCEDCPPGTSGGR